MKITNNLFLLRENDAFILKEQSLEKMVLTLEKQEVLDAVFIVFDGSLDVTVHLVDKESSCDLKCVYLAAGKEKIDISLNIIHACAQTNSKQTIKGILTDSSSVFFKGMIKMLPNAQKCIGYQNHRAVLLSEEAFVQAIPELEIYADDVQCSHGSAIGSLEKEGLFYLMARGIDEKEAEKMLIRAFLYDLIPSEYHFIADDWLNVHV